MKLKKKTDYTLRVLIYIISSGKRHKIQEISDYFGLSKNHLKVIINKLTQLKILLSYLGPSGGVEFNSECLNYKLGDLISFLEKDSQLVECFSEDGKCVIDQTCKLKGMLKVAETAFTDQLNLYTLKDLKN